MIMPEKDTALCLRNINKTEHIDCKGSLFTLEFVYSNIFDIA